jgi:hypothetical protein
LQGKWWERIEKGVGERRVRVRVRARERGRER